MKRLVIFFCFFFSIALNAQQKQGEPGENGNIEIPRDSTTGRISYKAIGYNAALSKEQIFKRALYWLKVNYNKLEDGVPDSDPEAGRIEQQAVFKLPMKGTEATIKQTIIILVKDGRSRIQITNFYYNYYLEGGVIGDTYHEGKEYEGNMEDFMYGIINAKLKIVKTMGLNTVDAFDKYERKMIKSYEDYIVKKQEVKKDDW